MVFEAILLCERTSFCDLFITINADGRRSHTQTLRCVNMGVWMWVENIIIIFSKTRIEFRILRVAQYGRHKFLIQSATDACHNIKGEKNNKNKTKKNRNFRAFVVCCRFYLLYFRSSVLVLCWSLSSSVALCVLCFAFAFEKRHEKPITLHITRYFRYFLVGRRTAPTAQRQQPASPQSKEHTHHLPRSMRFRLNGFFLWNLCDDVVTRDQ